MHDKREAAVSIKSYALDGQVLDVSKLLVSDIEPHLERCAWQRSIKARVLGGIGGSLEKAIHKMMIRSVEIQAQASLRNDTFLVGVMIGSGGSKPRSCARALIAPKRNVSAMVACLQHHHACEERRPPMVLNVILTI